MAVVEHKEEIIKEHRTHEGDTGSPEVQVAVLTRRISAPYGALARAQARLPFQAWTAEDGRQAPQVTQVSAEEGRRALPGAHRQARPTPVVRVTRKARGENNMRLDIPVGERSIVLETGKLAKQAGGSVTARLGDTMILSTATRSQAPASRRDVLATQRGHRGAHVLGGEDPRRLYQARGQALGAGDPDLASHGQASQAALPQELSLRDTGNRHCSRR